MLDIPYHGSEDDADFDSLQYVDARTVNVASTPRTARYWETRQRAPHVNASATAARTAVSLMLLCLWLLVVAVNAAS